VKSKYAKIGQMVRVITPKIFIRAGYPLTSRILLQTRKAEVDAMVVKAAEAMGMYILPPEIEFSIEDPIERLDHWVVRNLRQAVCCYLLRKEGFGGSERQVFEREVPNMTGATGKVLGKRTVKTGVHFGPCGGYDNFNNEYYYEPGGLTNEKTHVVYDVQFESYNLIHNIELLQEGTYRPRLGIQILAANCEIIPDLSTN
jgi:hypothetical protein